MARRNQGMFEDLVDLVSMLPWWVGATLAPPSYLLLHLYSLKELPKTSGMQGLNAVATGSILHAFAVFGQYILPFAFGLGAAISAYKQFVRRDLRNKVSASPMKDVLNNMTWHQFEMLVGEVYRTQGYQVQELGGSGPDGGADLVLIKKGEKVYVQCKQWKAYKVGVQPIRELLGVMVSKGATAGIVVTSGEFTADAINFARNNNIRLVDGHTLHQMTKGVQINNTQPEEKASSPVCQKCGSPMVLRTAKKGAYAGQKFWGCSGYPTCRFTSQFEN